MNLQFMDQNTLEAQLRYQKKKVIEAKYNKEQHDRMKAYIVELEAEIKRRNEESK